MKTHTVLIEVLVCLLICTCFFSGCNQVAIGNGEGQAEGTINPNLIYRDMRYVSFEEAIKECTNIVVGTYLGKSESGCNGSVFHIQKQIKGTIQEEELCAHGGYSHKCIVGTTISYVDDLQYTAGEAYLLVLFRKVSVYQDHDQYELAADIYIPISNLKNSKMYAYEPFNDHASYKIHLGTSKEDLYDYITSYLSENEHNTREFYGREYIHSTDFCDVISESEYVMKVSIGHIEPINPIEKTVGAQCKIIKQYKGIVSSDTVRILFKEGSVESGMEYIVATNGTVVKDLMHLSSKASIFTDLQEESILALIAE